MSIRDGAIVKYMYIQDVAKVKSKCRKQNKICNWRYECTDQGYLKFHRHGVAVAPCWALVLVLVTAEVTEPFQPYLALRSFLFFAISSLHERNFQKVGSSKSKVRNWKWKEENCRREKKKVQNANIPIEWIGLESGGKYRPRGAVRITVYERNVRGHRGSWGYVKVELIDSWLYCLPIIDNNTILTIELSGRKLVWLWYLILRQDALLQNEEGIAPSRRRKFNSWSGSTCLVRFTEITIPRA